jgi:hypothetical protein
MLSWRAEVVLWRPLDSDWEFWFSSIGSVQLNLTITARRKSPFLIV